MLVTFVGHVFIFLIAILSRIVHVEFQNLTKLNAAHSIQPAKHDSF